MSTANRPTQISTLGELLTTTYDLKWKSQSQAATRRGHISALHEALGINTPITQLYDLYWLTDQRDCMKETLRASNNTVNKYMGALRTAGNFCHKAGFLHQSMHVPVQLPQRQSRTYLPTGTDIAAIDDIADRKLKSALHVLRLTGLRCGELMRVTTDNLISGEGIEPTLYVDVTKNGLTRSIPLSTKAYYWLSVLSSFSQERQLCPLSYRQLAYGWNVHLRSRLGHTENPDFTPHILRHWFCTTLLAKGVSTSKVRVLMGHRLITTTQKYEHLNTDHVRPSVNLLT